MPANNREVSMNKSWKNIRAVALAAGAASLASACAYLQPEKVGQAEGREYTITVKNTLAKERFAPILVVGSADDRKIWVGQYVSPEAHTQFTTGNPGPLAKVLGGDQGQPGGLGIGQEVTFKFKTTAPTARLTAMVHPDFTPDNYVTALLDLKAPGTTMLERFDIGDDEGRKTVLKVGPAGSVTVK
jgi:hypothetical protein